MIETFVITLSIFVIATFIFQGIGGLLDSLSSSYYEEISKIQSTKEKKEPAICDEECYYRLRKHDLIENKNYIMTEATVRNGKSI